MTRMLVLLIFIMLKLSHTIKVVYYILKSVIFCRMENTITKSHIVSSHSNNANSFQVSFHSGQNECVRNLELHNI